MQIDNVITLDSIIEDIISLEDDTIGDDIDYLYDCIFGKSEIDTSLLNSYSASKPSVDILDVRFEIVVKEK